MPKSPLKTTSKAKNKAPEIVQSGDPVLHTPAKEVILNELQSPEIKKVLVDMKAALESQDDGVGLAAPQIGIPLRIFMVAGFIFDRIDYLEEMKNAIGPQPLTASGTEAALTEVDQTVQLNKKKKKNSHQFFINPKITKASKEKKWMDGEGCLSVRWLYGKVYRSTRVTLEYYNEKGEKLVRGASGILAHIFQHEVDHLDGILFTDKAKDLQEFDPDEIRKEAKLAKQRRNGNTGVEVDDDAEFETNE